MQLTFEKNNENMDIKMEVTRSEHSAETSKIFFIFVRDCV